MALSGLLQVVRSNKSDIVMIQQDVTRLTTQGCSNIVIIIVTALLEQPWNNLVTSLRISTSLL